MRTDDLLAADLAPELEGVYDCVDRIILNGYFFMGQTGGGMRRWWMNWHDDDVTTLGPRSLEYMAGAFTRRVTAWGGQHGVPVISCAQGTAKHELARELMAKRLEREPNFEGIFCVLVARAPNLQWTVLQRAGGQPFLQRRQPWPLLNHLHFHVLDKEWGHVCFKISTHPPFGCQVMLNGHEFVERRARAAKVAFEKSGNAFTGGDVEALDGIAQELSGPRLPELLAALCERWIYTACLCFALRIEDQQRSGFRYGWSVYQIEYSRNLLFKNAQVLEESYQGMIDRTRRHLDIASLKTILGWKRQPAKLCEGPRRAARSLQRLPPEMTVLKLSCGALGFKLYDKGARLLRMEVTAHHVRELKCGCSAGRLSLILPRMQQLCSAFLDQVHSAHRSTLRGEWLDELPRPSVRGTKRIAGVNLQQERMRQSVRRVIAVAVKAPQGFTLRELAATKRQAQCEAENPGSGPPEAAAPLTPASAAETTEQREGVPENKSASAKQRVRQMRYDLSKLRAKGIVERIAKTHRYRATLPGIRQLAGMLTLQEQVLKPVLAGLRESQEHPPPHWLHRLDERCLETQHALRGFLQELGLAA